MVVNVKNLVKALTKKEEKADILEREQSFLSGLTRLAGIEKEFEAAQRKNDVDTMNKIVNMVVQFYNIANETKKDLLNMPESRLKKLGADEQTIDKAVERSYALFRFFLKNNKLKEILKPELHEAIIVTMLLHISDNQRMLVGTRYMIQKIEHEVDKLTRSDQKERLNLFVQELNNGYDQIKNLYFSLSTEGVPRDKILEQIGSVIQQIEKDYQEIKKILPPEDFNHKKEPTIKGRMEMLIKGMTSFHENLLPEKAEKEKLTQVEPAVVEEKEVELDELLAELDRAAERDILSSHELGLARERTPSEERAFDELLEELGQGLAGKEEQVSVSLPTGGPLPAHLPKEEKREQPESQKPDLPQGKTKPKPIAAQSRAEEKRTQAIEKIISDYDTLIEKALEDIEEVDGFEKLVSAFRKIKLDFASAREKRDSGHPVFGQVGASQIEGILTFMSKNTNELYIVLAIFAEKFKEKDIEMAKQALDEAFSFFRILLQEKGTIPSIQPEDNIEAFAVFEDMEQRFQKAREKSKNPDASLREEGKFDMKLIASTIFSMSKPFITVLKEADEVPGKLDPRTQNALRQCLAKITMLIRLFLEEKDSLPSELVETMNSVIVVYELLVGLSEPQSVEVGPPPPGSITEIVEPGVEKSKEEPLPLKEDTVAAQKVEKRGIAAEREVAPVVKRKFHQNLGKLQVFSNKPGKNQDAFDKQYTSLQSWFQKEKENFSTHEQHNIEGVFEELSKHTSEELRKKVQPVGQPLPSKAPPRAQAKGPLPPKVPPAKGPVQPKAPPKVLARGPLKPRVRRPLPPTPLPKAKEVSVTYLLNSELSKLDKEAQTKFLQAFIASPKEQLQILNKQSVESLPILQRLFEQTSLPSRTSEAEYSKAKEKFVEYMRDICKREYVDLVVEEDKQRFLTALTILDPSERKKAFESQKHTAFLDRLSSDLEKERPKEKTFKEKRVIFLIKEEIDKERQEKTTQRGRPLK